MADLRLLQALLAKLVQCKVCKEYKRVRLACLTMLPNTNHSRLHFFSKHQRSPHANQHNPGFHHRANHIHIHHHNHHNHHNLLLSNLVHIQHRDPIEEPSHSRYTLHSPVQSIPIRRDFTAFDVKILLFILKFSG